MNIGKNDVSEKGITDEYLQNTEITNQLQEYGPDNIQYNTSDQEKCEKLFDHPNSNNFLYPSSHIKSKSSEDVVIEGAGSYNTFKCYYCSEYYSSDVERVKHIDHWHQGRLYYPTPEDFRNRFN